MQEVIKADGTVLCFEGELIAYRSSAVPEKERWTELALWYTKDDQWILSVVGRSTVRGEINRHSVTSGGQAVEVLDLLVAETRLAKLLLGDALDHLIICDSDDDREDLDEEGG